jgi:dTDP-glucose 4,6-dehydratase
LYAADLATWLWTILFQGRPREAYNIGSEEAISIAELAKLISNGHWVKRKLEVQIAKQPVSGVPVARYVPSTRKAQVELGLKQKYFLAEAIDRTLSWHRARQRI